MLPKWLSWTVICATMVFGFPLATGMETINDNSGKYMDIVVRNAEPISKVSNRILIPSVGSRLKVKFWNFYTFL
ncbi:unnamed protein product [Haemonchus placei]|uniref:Secreted protein n=1 Tax=Haemonchus placei TaxID=6290 RepID=A0A0N4WJR3_HAEPC|nr:unnamed protein product [Haemonchus placei]